MIFASCDYFATGEGRTVCLLITRAYPREGDYKTKPSYNSTSGKYDPGKLKTTDRERATVEFIEKFGIWYARGIEFHTQEEFLEKFRNYLPSFMEKLINDRLGNLNWSMQCHTNFS